MAFSYKKTYLNKLLSSFNSLETPQLVWRLAQLSSTSTFTYDFTKILNKRKKPKLIVTIPNLQSKSKIIKTELQNFKQVQQKDYYFTTPSLKISNMILNNKQKTKP